MYQKFVATNLEIDNVKRSVLVHFSLDVDEDTVNETSIYVTKKGINNVIHCNYAVHEDTIELIFDEEFEVNRQYMLYVTFRLLSITCEKLAHETIRDFTIESNVDSECTIITPSNHEDLKELTFTWKETPGKSKKLANSFYLEIAPDLHFFRPLVKTEVRRKKSFTVKTLEPAKQYFVRVRSQKSEKDYGNWCEPVTFTYSAPVDSNDDDDEIVYVKSLELISKIEDGLTPKHSFILEFDKELDTSSIEDIDIMLFRKEL